jgi:hypothetical protein
MERYAFGASRFYVRLANTVKTTDDAKRVIAAAYLAYISMPGSEYDAEYAAYADALADLGHPRRHPAGVAYAYVGEL